jgi:hypothetical protein
MHAFDFICLQVYKQTPSYIRPKMRRKISEDISKIKLPHDFARTVRSLDNRKYWNGLRSVSLDSSDSFACPFLTSSPYLAHEWHVWGRIFSPLLLRKRLKPKYYNSYLLLIRAVRLLLYGPVSEADIANGNDLTDSLCDSLFCAQLTFVCLMLLMY